MQSRGVLLLIYARRICRRLPSNLVADGVLLLIEHLLLAFGDVTAVQLGHIPFFLADGVVLTVKLACLLFGDLALLQLAMNPTVLVGEAVVDLIAPRMIALPSRFGKGRGHGAADDGE